MRFLCFVLLVLHFWFFFFFSSRRRHTRFKCDWSSDVCSSDLGGAPGADGLLRLGVRRGLEPRLDEGVVQELLRVEKRERARARAEDDHDELLAPAPHRHREVVARLAREAGLAGLDAAPPLEEPDGPRVDAAVEDERLAAEQEPGVRRVVQQARAE